MESISDHEYLNFDPKNPHILPTVKGDFEQQQAPVADPSTAGTQQEQQKISKGYVNLDISKSLPPRLIEDSVSREQENTRASDTKDLLQGSETRLTTKPSSIPPTAPPLVLPKPRRTQTINPSASFASYQMSKVSHDGTSKSKTLHRSSGSQSEIAESPTSQATTTRSLSALERESKPEGENKSIRRGENNSIRERARFLLGVMQGTEVPCTDDDESRSQTDKKNENDESPRPSKKLVRELPVGNQKRETQQSSDVSSEPSPELSKSLSIEISSQYARQEKNTPKHRIHTSKSLSTSPPPFSSPTHSYQQPNLVSSSNILPSPTAISITDAAVSTDDKPSRPMLSLIKQRIAVKKESELVNSGSTPSKNGPSNLSEIKQKISKRNHSLEATTTEAFERSFTMPRPARKDRNVVESWEPSRKPVSTSNSNSEGNRPSSASPKVPPKLKRGGVNRVKAQPMNNDAECSSGAVSPPPPVPPRTEAMFQVRESPDDRTVNRRHAYLNVSLIETSEPSVVFNKDETVEKESMLNASKKKSTLPRKKLEIKEPADSDGRKKRYPHVILPGLFGKGNKGGHPSLNVKKQTSGEKKSPDKKPFTQAAKTKPSVDMSTRPLPPPPGLNQDEDSAPEHTEQDYEDLNMDMMCNEDYQNYPQSTLVQFSHGTKQDPSVGVMRLKTFSHHDRRNIQRPKLSLPTQESLDYIDGYVNTNPPSRNTLDESDNLEYAYPDIHGTGLFRSPSARKEYFAKLERMQSREPQQEEKSSESSETLAQLLGLKINNKKAEEMLSRTYSNTSCEYVPMASGVMDDSYINWESGTFSSKDWEQDLPSRTQNRSSYTPDMSTENTVSTEVEKNYDVYMNLPTPEKLFHLPPRPSQIPPAKPTSSMINEEGSHLKARHQKSPVNSSSKVPPTKSPKPRTKQRANTTVSSTPTNRMLSIDTNQSFEADYQNFGCLPMKSTFLTSSNGETGPPPDKLPPRDILRPNIL